MTTETVRKELMAAFLLILAITATIPAFATIVTQPFTAAPDSQATGPDHANPLPSLGDDLPLRARASLYSG